MGKSNSLQHFLSTLSHLQSHFPNPEQLDSFLNLSLPHPHPPSCPPEAKLICRVMFTAPLGVFLEFPEIHCDIDSFLTVLRDIYRVIHSKSVGCRLSNWNWHPRNPHTVTIPCDQRGRGFDSPFKDSSRQWLLLQPMFLGGPHHPNIHSRDSPQASAAV